MLYKFALCEAEPILIDAKESNGENKDFIKTASGKRIVDENSEKIKIIQAEMEKHPTALFFRAKAIKADETNSNGDYFSEEELLKSYKTFEGVPFFTNHDNKNIENAKGKIIFAEWNPQEKSIYTISFVDREAFPHICRSIEEEYVSGVSMGALCGEATITMADRSEKRISDIVAGDEIMSAYGNSKKVSLVHEEFLGKQMYKFDLTTFHKSSLYTENHPIFSIDKIQVGCAKNESISLAHKNEYSRRSGNTSEFVGQDVWREKKYDTQFRPASNISVGDYFLVPSKFNIVDGESQDSDLYYVVGAYLGDGYLRKDKLGNYCAVSFCFGKDEIELAKKVTDILKKYTNANANTLICEERNGLYINFYDKKLAQWFNENFGTGSKNKRIKLNIGLKNDALNLLAGYLDTDGCIAKKINPKHTSAFQYSSANLGLLEDIQSILISLDSVSRISCMERTPSENSVVSVNTTEYTLSVGSNSSNIFGKSIKYANNNIQNGKINAGKTFITSVNDKKYMACPVKSVEIVDFQEPVYDITVEDDESYIADGIAVHNCSVEYSVCSICGNRAENTDDFCSHIRNRKGRTFTGSAKNVITGETKQFHNAPVFEYNYGIKFIELSAVVDPACPSCRIEKIIENQDYLKKVANVENGIHMIKSAFMEKQADQTDINQLNTVLKTLEDISVKLIKNRKQVEVEFASDLVEILSELQTFVDELVGAGYGNVGGQVPGTGQEPALPPSGEGNVMPVNLAPVAEESTQPATAQPAATEAPAQGATGVGTVSGSPTKSPVQVPALPITAPAKPIRSMVLDKEKLNKISQTIQEINSYLDNQGEENMGKRRILAEKIEQKKKAIQALSESWNEKKEFFDYIQKMPSVQEDGYRLEIKKNNETFIIVASSKDNKKVWSFDDLNKEEKNLIKNNPKNASIAFLKAFRGLNTNKEGENRMATINKEAGAKSVNDNTESTTEVQLNETKGLYHPRQNDDKHATTEEQLKAKRTEKEPDVLTEKQLDEGIKLHPRTGESIETTEENQLADIGGNEVSGAARVETEQHEITQKQLETNNRTGTEPETLTEDQLKKTDDPWARVAQRDPSQFKSAGEHVKAVINAFADSVLSTGGTPNEICKVASSLIGSTKDRVEFTKAIFTDTGKEEVNVAQRLAYWSGKSFKVASSGTKEIANSIVKEMAKVAAEKTINPDTLIDAMDVINETADNENIISKAVDAKLAAAKTKGVVVANKKEEMRKALAEISEVKSGKEARDEERKQIIASVEAEDKKIERVAERKEWKETISKEKVADTIIETSFDEIGCKKGSENLKSAIRNFAKGALAARDMKLASIVNVTVNGETVQIAVQTDEGDQSVNIPIGDQSAPATEETIPEGDMTGAGLGEVPPAIPEAAPAAAPALAGSKKTVKTAQVGGAGGGMPGGAGAGVPSGAPEGGIPNAPAMTDAPLQAITQDEAPGAEGEELATDEIPTTGEQNPMMTICPECNSGGNVDVTVDKDTGGWKGKCNNCGAEYEALIEKNIEFKITKPRSEEGAEEPAAPEVPALPVAAQTRIDKNSIVRIASNKEKFGHVCPACGMSHCKPEIEKNASVRFTCPACKTQVEKDIIVGVNNPAEQYLRVKWDLIPDIKKCAGCKKSLSKFASMIKVEKMMKSAAKRDFPMANCIERMARRHGGNAVATFGPCKGEALAECVCKQLQKLGLTKVRHMDKLASVMSQKDPMDECIEDQLKSGKFSVKEAKNICNCLKKAHSSKEDMIYVQAFAEDIEDGVEKDLAPEDLEVMDEMAFPEATPALEADIVDEDIGDDLPELDEVTITVSEEAANEIKDAIEKAAPSEVEEVEIETEPVAATEPVAELPEEVPAAEGDIQKEKDMALSMKINKLNKVSEDLVNIDLVKVGGKPERVKDVEQTIKGVVPRSKGTIRNEGPDNIDVKLNTPNVPRANATMGKEGPDNVDVEVTLPDVSEGNAYLGKEKEMQSAMPENSNRIKGTVIAKKLKEVDTVEQDADVPRKNQTLGEEGKGNIDVEMKKPDVPRGDAAMGEESKDNINVDMDAPDVPMGDAKMGGEKETQKDMPANNDEMLKNVKAKNEIQMERIANARWKEATKIASKLLATNRITEEAFDDVVEALSKFEIDKIVSVASKMYPARVKVASVGAEQVYSGPAIVLESKVQTEDTLQNKLSKQFTIGNTKFDQALTQFGEK